MVTITGGSSHQGRKPDAVSMVVGWGPTLLWGLLLTLHLGITPKGVLAQEFVRLQRLIIIPSMTITGQYDTNITRVPTDEIEDYSTTYSPGASISYRWPNTVLSGSYFWDFEEFDDLETRNNMSQSGSGQLTHVFNPFVNFTGGASYSKTESEGVDLDLTVLGGLAESARERQSSESLGANAAIQLAYFARLPIGLNYSFSDNLASAADEVDVQSHTFGANASYLVVPARGHSLNASYTVSVSEENRNTTRSPADPALNFAANNSTDHSVTASYTHRFDPSFSATGGGGVSWASHSSDPRLEDELDPIYFASLTKRWTRTGVGLNGTLDTGRGGGFAGTTTTKTVGLVADHAPHPNLSLGLNLNLSDSELENGATGLDRDNLRYLVSPSFSYQFLRYFSLSGSYSYSRNEFDDEGGAFVPTSEFQEFTAGVAITLRPYLPQFAVRYSHSESDSEDDADGFVSDLLFFSVNYSLPIGL